MTAQAAAEQGFIAKLMARSQRLRQREYWSRERLARYQRLSLERLRRFAYAHSPFYREFHAGLMERSLEELPVLSKSLLMERFEQIVTEPGARRDDMERYLETDAPGQLFLGRYFLTASSGTTGHRALFLSDTSEWLTSLASMSRQGLWMGLRQVQRKRKIAYGLSTVPWHGSARLLHFVDRNLTSVFQLDAGDPLESIVERLNQWQPEMLTLYASLARVLADEQLQGHLNIHPEVVSTGGDVLTEDTRQRIQRAWGQTPYNSYAATEAAVLAAECNYHAGLHVFEDLVIVENVDDRNRPVPPGEYGAKVLITVPFRRVIPLIRYVLEDVVRFSTQPCPCGRTLRLIDDIRGRANEVLWLETPRGSRAPVHPNFFYKVMDSFPVRDWQVVHRRNALDVLVTEPRAEFDEAAVRIALERAIQSCDALAPPIRVLRVAQIPRGRTGKALLVKAETELS